MKKFALANEELLFAKKEDIEGTLIYPTDDDVVLAVGPATSNQEIEFLDDAQIRSRRSRLSQIKGRENPGAWNFTTYVKPSGTLGDPPEADVLFECALGKRLRAGDDGYDAGKVEYRLDSTSNLPSFSLIRKVGHTIFFMAGCTVNVMEASVAGNEIAQVAWNGEFMKWWMAGEDTLAEALSADDDHIHVADPTRFSDEKARVQIQRDNGTWDRGADDLGYLITSTNYTTGIMGISPNIQAGGGGTAGNTIKGWVPDAPSEKGSPIHGKLGVVTIDLAQAIILTSTITLTNNIKYYVDMKSSKLYPTVYGAPGFRDVNGTLALYFYKNTTGYFYRSAYQIQDALMIPAGNVASRRMKINCPYIEYKAPVLSGDEEVMIELAFTAVGSTTGDDELTVIFD